MAAIRQLAFAWFIFSEEHVSWACLAVSERRELVDGLHERFSSFSTVPSSVVVAASAADDDVEAAGKRLPWPSEYSWLRHERFGVE